MKMKSMIKVISLTLCFAFQPSPHMQLMRPLK